MSYLDKVFSLKEKNAIVTGGAMGIGKAIVESLANAGANVLIVDREEPEDIPGSYNLEERHGELSFLKVDLSEDNCVDLIMAEAKKNLGTLDILVNNAGIFKYMPLLNMSEEIWDKTLHINLRSSVFLAREAAKIMVEQGKGGRIINISSVDSFKPTGNLSHYDASKGGLRIVTKAMAKELGPHGITVNDLAPGGVNTPGIQTMAPQNMSDEEKEAMAQQMQAFISSLPLGRMGEPSDIGEVVIFMASDASRYMTGSTITVDGGLLIT